MRRIEILTFPGGQLLDVAGPLQVFATANDLAHLAARPLPYETAVVAKVA
jgi:transcriptional regulator GlxA family with amidase domain